ncbi:TVP38/TMEM64 family protein [Haliea sp.]
MLANQTVFQHHLLEEGLWNAVLISGAGAIFTGFGGPRQLLAFISGFALGPAWGTVYATAITLSGAIGCFYIARLFLRSALESRAHQRMKTFNALTRDQPLIKILMIRLLPVGSNLLTNLFAGSSRIGAGPFLLGSGIGYLPQMMIFSLIGAGFGQASQLQFVLATCMFLVAAGLGLFLYRDHRNRILAESVIKPHLPT